MANVSTTSMIDKRDNDHYIENKEVKYFGAQFSEKDVLELQQIFLTFGVHYIKTNNIETGRTIIQTILGSLKHYQNVGAVTHIAGLQETVCDILVYIKMQGFCSDDIAIDLESFFTVHACFDFIWIELTSSLQAQDLINIKNIFDMYHAQERMPVLFVMYEDLL